MAMRGGKDAKAMTNGDVLSQTITFLRLPLIVAVVFIHTVLADITMGGFQLAHEGQFPAHDLLRHIISGEIAQTAVPLFFFISGFLFFRRTDFSAAAYGRKLKRRVRTLLVPYVFWNAAEVLKIFLAQTFLPHMISSGSYKPVADYNWSDWLSVFWNFPGSPANFPLWFVRDLMVIILFAPAVCCLVRYGKAAGVAVLGALHIFGMEIVGGGRGNSRPFSSSLSARGSA